MLSNSNTLLLLRRLTTLPLTGGISTRIGTRRVALPYRFPCTNFPTERTFSKVHTPAHHSSRFLSTSAATVQVHDEDVSSAKDVAVDTASENTSNSENGGGAFQQFFSRRSSASSDHDDDKNKIAVSTGEGSPSADEEDGVGFKALVSRPANYYDMPPEEVVRTGKFLWLNFSKKCGMIIQDEEFVNVGPIKTKKVFLTFRNIYPELRIDNRVEMNPSVDQKRRVKFQVKPNPIVDESKLVAFNVRYEDGGAYIPLFHWEETLYLIQKFRASFGHEVYDILEQGKDANTIAKSIQLAKKKCDKAVDIARKQIKHRPDSKPDTLIKSRLGEEIYDILSNISSVDNPETASDDAYFRCVHDLSMLGFDIEPSNNHAKKHVFELGFKARRALDIKRKYIYGAPNQS